VEGVFTRWDADVRFDPQDVGASSIKVNVDAASAATGDAERDQALPSADWFDAKRFASATYETQSISDLGDGKYEATGTLTLRGTSRAVPLRFTFTVADGVATMKVQSALTRTDFGVGQGQFATGGTVSADVAVEAELRLTRKP
jgi:polyisoprenoid-binding protein YceI